MCLVTEDPTSTIVAIPDYHTIPLKRVDSSPFSQTPLIRKWCRGILTLQDPLIASGNTGERRRKSRRSLIGLPVARTTDIREEVTRILKERKSKSG